LWQALSDAVAAVKLAKSTLEGQLAFATQEILFKRQEVQSLEQENKAMVEKLMAFERERVKAESSQQAAQTKAEQLAAEMATLRAQALK
jgi:chromosome segregation ATPase